MGTPTTLSLLFTRNGIIDTKVYLTVKFDAYGYLLAGGLAVVGKTITVTYNGTSLGSAVTGSNGRYDLTDLDIFPPTTEGAYVGTADFAGDATYDASQGTFNFDVYKMPSKIEAAIPSDFPEDQYVVFTGYLLNDVPDYEYQGYPISLQTILLRVDGIIETSATTDLTGKFQISWLFDDADEYSIRLEYPESQLYKASHVGSYSGKELEIWNFRYPQPEDVEDECYAWVLCIDPNAIRGGPIYYILDSAKVLPGLTTKSGSFSGQLNDNTKEFDDGFIQDRMYLLGPDKPFIYDQDEFWIGLQREAVSKRWDPWNHTWDSTGGTDGKGAGIYWIMGGYISKRYYSRDFDKRCTAIILGKDYMDVWRDQRFGTEVIPRSYETPTSLDVIISDILSDVNAQQEEEYKYTPHPTYFDGVGVTGLRISASYSETVLEVVDESNFNIGDVIKIWDLANPEGETLTVTGTNNSPPQIDVDSGDPVNPGIQNIYGYDKASASVVEVAGAGTVLWQTEFIEDSPFDIMQKACQEQVYDWKINHLRQVMYYSRANPPLPTDEHIRYTTNIRDVPEIVVGDTNDLVTNIIVKDGLSSTLPADISQWCVVPDSWIEITTWGMRTYGPILTPPPSNPISKTYTDFTLVWDDEGYPALCFQYQGVQIAFQIHHGCWMPDGPGGGESTGILMEADLRKYRRIKFKWRHLTRDGSANTKYSIRLHSRKDVPTPPAYLNDLFEFQFGEGIQEDLGYSRNDTITNGEWTLIDLLLPQPNEDGTIDFGDTTQMKGWTVVGNPDPILINWLSFSFELHEADPGYATSSGKSLTSTANQGDFFIKVNDPQHLGGWPTGDNTRRMFSRPVDCLLIGSPTTKRENVEVQLVNCEYASPAGRNIRLNAPLINSYTTAAKLWVKAGKTISFSQLHLERDFQEGGEESFILGPKRYGIYDADELKFQSEVDKKVEEILNEVGTSKQYVKVKIDGDPEKEIGRRVRTYLDPAHSLIFQGTPMIIDNVQYDLTTVDLAQTLTLTPITTSNKPSEITEFNRLDRTNLNLRKIGRRGRKTWQ